VEVFRSPGWSRVTVVLPPGPVRAAAAQRGTIFAPVSCSCASTSEGTYFLPWPSADASASD
jgi:hypothetical protein